MRRPSRRRALAGAALLTAAALAGCSYPDPEPSGLGGAEPSASPSASPSAPAADTRSKAPLTGAPADAKVVGRSAVAIPVTGSAPVGLDKADLVIEEISSPVRYVGVFHSQDSARVGPVAQTRPSDIMGLTLLRPVYGFRDGPNGMVDQVKRSALLPLNSAVRGDAFTAEGSSIFASTATLRTAASAPPAKQLLVYGDDVTGPVPGGKQAKQVTVAMPRGGTQTWTYDAAKKLWSRSGGGPAAVTRNLIVQIVPYKAVTLSHRFGGSDVSARLFGTGVSYVMSGPQAIGGQWRKPGLPQQTNFLDAKLVPVRLAPGQSWVILAPSGTKVTTG
jgi:hypothetical protein